MRSPSIICLVGWLGPSHLRPGYSELQLRQLTRGMEGGPVSWAIAGLGLALVLLFVLLAAAVMQDRLDHRAARSQAEGPRKPRGGRRSPASAEERIWRRPAPVSSRRSPPGGEHDPGPPPSA